MSVPSITIKLAGADYPIPKLAPRQLRIIMPAATRLLKELGPIMMVAMGAREAPENIDPVAMLEGLEVTEKMFDDLIDVLWPAIAKGSPGFTREIMLDLDTGVQELLMALPTILKQTGIMTGEPKKEGEGGAPGEVMALEAQTG